MYTIREWLRVVEAASGGHFRYIGNCIDQDNGPHLGDMMDRAKKVPYREVYTAVGRDTLAEVFRDFHWDSKPNRFRGNMALHQDPYVAFYKSTFRNIQCYFVQESGIEYIFVSPAYFETNWDAPEQQKHAKRYYIASDGSIGSTSQNMSAVAAVIVAGKVMKVTQSAALNSDVATALFDLIAKHQPTEIDDDGEEATVSDYKAFLKSYLHADH